MINKYLLAWDWNYHHRIPSCQLLICSPRKSAGNGTSISHAITPWKIWPLTSHRWSECHKWSSSLRYNLKLILHLYKFKAISSRECGSPGITKELVMYLYVIWCHYQPQLNRKWWQQELQHHYKTSAFVFQQFNSRIWEDWASLTTFLKPIPQQFGSQQAK